MKIILSSFFIIFTFSFISCVSVGQFYNSTASIQRISSINKTKFKIIYIEKDSYYHQYNFGIILATDIINGKKISYLLISPKITNTFFDPKGDIIEDYIINDSSVLFSKQASELISVLNDVITDEFEKTDGLFFEYRVTPESFINQTHKNIFTHYSTLKFNYQSTKNFTLARLIIDSEQGDISDKKFLRFHPTSYIFYRKKSVQKFKELLEKGLEELLKLENVK